MNINLSNQLSKKICTGKVGYEQKIIASIIVFAIAFGSPIQVLALEKASRDAYLFKRYGRNLPIPSSS